MFNHLIKFKSKIRVVNSSTIFMNGGGLEPLDWQRCFRGSAANEIGNTANRNDGSNFPLKTAYKNKQNKKTLKTGRKKIESKRIEANTNAPFPPPP